jgi:putative membrane protein
MTANTKDRLKAALNDLGPKLHDVGEEPDPRFTFANERTFLAWIRTALALIAGGLAAAQALHFGLGRAHLIVAVPAILLGGLIIAVSYFRWQSNERAMRLGEPLGISPLTRIVAFGLILLALVSAVLVVVAAIVD